MSEESEQFDNELMKSCREKLENFKDEDFWEMECVKISVKKQLDDLTYAQKLRDEEKDELK